MASAMPKFKLTYLPVRARAENIRMMLRFAGIEYEDEIIGGPAWAAAKKTQPFDKLPVVTRNARVSGALAFDGDSGTKRWVPE